MPNEKELQQFIYELLETQLKFGVHRYGDSLPTIKEASTYFLASQDTVRHVYLRLKVDGYISLSTCVGAVVKVQYSDEEIRRYIQEYFSLRRDSMLAIVQSAGELTNYAQWFALRRAAPETLDELEELCLKTDIPMVYRMSRQLQLIFEPLGNDLLLSLLWKLFLYFQAPFVSSPESFGIINDSQSSFLGIVQTARKKDWTALRNAINLNVKQYCFYIDRFIKKNITQSPCDKQIGFTWSIYKKTSQICYSICNEVLKEISEGRCTAGSFIPSPQKLAQEKKVSCHTIRRTIVLLNKLGAVRSINGVGTRVLPQSDGAFKCDFTDSTIQKRLLDFLKCIHILSLSCRACARNTICTMSADSIDLWIQRLQEVKQSGIYEIILYTNYDIIFHYAPHPIIRVVYAELTRQLFWGNPLQGIHGDRESTNAYFLPFLERQMNCLACIDAEGFSASLEKMLMAEFRYVARYLSGLGMEEAVSIILTDSKNYF